MFVLNKIIKQIKRQNQNHHQSDKILRLIIYSFIVFGLVALSSATSVISYYESHDAYYFFKHQLIGLFLGIIAFWFCSNIDYRIWKKQAFWFLIFSVVLLLLVFIPGLSANWGKARSWIDIFGFSLQPSEFVKLFFLLYLAAWLEKRKEKLEDVSQGIGPFVVVLLIIALLLIMQPDVGTLSIIFITSLVVYYVGGGKLKHLFFICIFGLLAFSLMVVYKPYQFNRFKCLMDPNFSRQDICYQTYQSLIAIGSGGFWGRGLGESRQKYLYLPEVQGDSIFAIIAEELGLIVSIFLIAAYFFLFYRGYIISKHAPDDFGRILAIGIVSWITIQALINIGGITNILPMTGVPLPFISYGGSAMLATLAGVGILVNISKQTKTS